MNKTLVIEYLDEYNKCIPVGSNTLSQIYNGSFTENYKARERLVKKFSWAVPTAEALECIVSWSPNGVIEIGAGNGYWAYLLDQLGLDVRAYDIAPPRLGSNAPIVEGRSTPWFDSKEWYPIQKGDASAARWYPDRTLLLCWPPYDTRMAKETLDAYKGDVVIYVGEGSGGCNGDDDFHSTLNNEWEEVECVNIPQWFGIHDYLTVYKRKLILKEGIDNGKE